LETLCYNLKRFHVTMVSIISIGTDVCLKDMEKELTAIISCKKNVTKSIILIRNASVQSNSFTIAYFISVNSGMPGSAPLLNPKNKIFKLLVSYVQAK